MSDTSHIDALISSIESGKFVDPDKDHKDDGISKIKKIIGYMSDYCKDSIENQKKHLEKLYPNELAIAEIANLGSMLQALAPSKKEYIDTIDVMIMLLKAKRNDRG